MKKNISINISGIIFHIEEDGYDKLKSYLNSIHQYFSTYEENEEIIADIENRIAEIFLSKLGQHKQVITIEDVQELIATMGTVDDFEVIEGESKQQRRKQQANYQSDFAFEENNFHYSNEGGTTEDRQTNEKKKLYRDLKRKLIAGVASGIAHYFSIDPLWIRLIFAATFLGVFGAEIIPTIALITYIALWIVTPVSDNLPEDTKIKKLFRNPDKRILGGVASGLASYFGADETIIRLLFVLGIPLGGTGLIIYLILWAITPEAKTLTEKMQMEGEPVTLSNIEKKIKESFNISEDDEENIFAKILVFPFQIIAKIFNFLSENFKPLGNFIFETIRVLAGSVLTMGSFVVVLGLLIFLAMFLGLFSIPAASHASIDGIPLSLIRQSVPLGGVLALVFILLIPFVTLGITGVSLIARRKVVSTAAAWTLFSIWILGLLGAAATIPPFVQSFQIEGNHKEIKTYKADAPLITLGLNYTKEGLNLVRLTIRGYEGKEIKLVQKVEARGASQEDANRNAQTVIYSVKNKGDSLLFDKTFFLKDNSAFRSQNVSMELFIPYGKEFAMQEDLGEILRHTLHPFGYGRQELKKEHRWTFDENGLKCLNCPEKVAEKEEEIDEEQERSSDNTSEETFTKEINDFKGFKKIQVRDNLEVEIEGGKDFSIVLDGENKMVKDIQITQDGEELKIGLKTDSNRVKKWLRYKAKIYISMPSMNSLYLKGASTATLSGFKEKEMNIILVDHSECEVNAEIAKLNIVAKDRSEIDVAGQGEYLSILASDRAAIDAFDYEAQRVNVKANDRSSVRVFASETIYMDSKDKGGVVYKGKPKVVNSKGNNGIE